MLESQYANRFDPSPDNTLSWYANNNDDFDDDNEIYVNLKSGEISTTYPVCVWIERPNIF